MTTPTQAQIKAARAEYCRVIAKAVDDRHEVTTQDGLDAIAAALTVAAQVGEQDWELKWKCREMALVALSEAAIAATIERCEQVAKDAPDGGSSSQTRANIIAAIRKLRDEA